MKTGRPRIPGIKLITLRLRAVDIRTARQVAKKRSLPYQAVIREWVAAQAATAA